MSLTMDTTAHARTARIESLLSARLFLSPQLVGQRLFFLSNMSGRISLYAMDMGGSVPEPLLPPQIALQNPELMDGYVFYVFPELGQILVMIDQDGDENYQPMLIPLDGGLPVSACGDRFTGQRTHLLHCDARGNMAYLNVEARQEQLFTAYQLDLGEKELQPLRSAMWGSFVAGVNGDHSKAVLIDGYTAGDHVLYLWEQGAAECSLLYGTPLEQRAPGQEMPLSGILDCAFTPGDRGVLCVTALFSDTYGLGYLPLERPGEIVPVALSGAVHEGMGELTGLKHLHDGRYRLDYNIDGCSWLYEGAFDEGALRLSLDTVVCGQGDLSNGVLAGVEYDKEGDRYALSFSTATTPTQIYIVEADRRVTTRQTRERILGIPEQSLAAGEDASFTSFDGLRVSARLYRPAEALGFTGPRPLVYYIHGGPQGQERPDFAWFSMPLIQFLTLHGFAVFVPNVRGSTGYGLMYTKKVDHDWGGDDRLDHVHALSLLSRDERIDTSRAAVMGRSYGGYMTLTLAARHPELWSAAVDMFGPYDLLRFMDNVPETWKPYFKIAVGDPETERAFLVERSPSAYIEQITCPLLVVQGQNDPRVVEQESRKVVDDLLAKGKEVEYLVFPDEGHDVIKFGNRVRCYNTITEFFTRHLHP